MPNGDISKEEKKAFWDWVKATYGYSRALRLRSSMNAGRFFGDNIDPNNETYKYWVSIGQPGAEIPEEPAPEQAVELPQAEWVDQYIPGYEGRVSIPVLPVEQLTSENIRGILEQNYGDLSENPELLENLIQASAYQSMAQHLITTKNVSAEMINNTTDLQNLLMDWSTKISTHGISGQGFAQVAETVQGMAPPPDLPAERKGRGVGTREWQPHLTRMGELERVTNQDPWEMYQQDIEAMRTAADTGVGVRLNTGAFDPWGAGFTGEGYTPGETRPATAGQYYTGKQGITVHLPDVENWSGEAYARYIGGGAPRAQLGIDVSRLSEAEKADAAILAGKAYPKGSTVRVPPSEAGEEPRFPSQEFVTGEFTIGGRFQKGAKGKISSKEWYPHGTPEQQERKRWEDLVLAAKSRPERVTRL